MSRHLKNIGIMGNSLRPMAGLDSVYGYDIAVNDNLRALMQYGSFNEITYINEPMQYQIEAIKRMHRSIKKSGKTSSNMEFVSEYDLISKKANLNIDVLHNVGMEFMPQVFCREAISQGAFPITYTIHGASYPNYIDSFYLMKLLMPFRCYDSLICTSRAVKSAVSNMLNSISESLSNSLKIELKYRGRLDVLPLGIDTEFFKPFDRIQAREHFNIPKEAFVMLWVGRFSAYDKADILPLITVLKRLIAKNPNKQLLLLLAGHDRVTMPFLPYVKKFIDQLGMGEHVRILDNHNLSDRNLLLSSSDVFVSPADNIQETFGLTPLEAMACGVPQVVADWDGYRDTVKDQETGFLVPTYWAKCDNDITEAGLLPSEPNHRSALHHLLMAQSVAVDLNAYEAAIQKLIDYPELRSRMSEASVKRAQMKFSWKNVIPQYEELWSELIDVAHSKEQKDDSINVDFIKPLYCEAFQEYPTRFISKKEFLSITSEGHDLLNDKHPLPLHYSVETIRDEIPLAKKLIEIIAEKEKIQITDLICGFTDQFSESILMRSCMWLIKHGFAILE